MQKDLVIKNTTIQDKVRKESPISMGLFATKSIGDSYPAISKSDFIEIETKVGGISKVSMLRLTLAQIKIELAMFKKIPSDLISCVGGRCKTMYCQRAVHIPIY